MEKHLKSGSDIVPGDINNGDMFLSEEEAKKFLI
jgi:hypothetical protein